MKLEKAKIELDMYGEIIALRKPTFQEAREYRDDLKKLSESEDASLIIQKFLEKMGLPEGKFNDLEFDHVNEILDVIMSPKKK